jgi:membrane-bound ClpP family serine protease
LLTIVFLILIGIVLLILEILILPGLIAGIIGGILIITGIILTYTNYGNTYGHITFAATAIVTGISIWYAFKSRVWERFGLQQTSDGKIIRLDELNIQPGDAGITLSVVRPSGTALFDNKKLEVHSRGEIIDSNKIIEVIEVLPNKLIVKEKVKQFEDLKI